MKIENVNYSRIADDLKTFDIILMHGLLMSSRLIELAEFSKWSHVGMVIRSEDIGLSDKKHSTVLLWEATDYVNLKDVILNIKKTGPMLVNLGERIKANYETRTDVLTAVRYLNTDRTPKMYDDLLNVIAKVHHAHLPTASKLVKKLFKGRILHRKGKHDNFFCSELITYTLGSIGLLPEELASNRFEPKDYSSKGYLPLLKRSTLSDEVYVTHCQY
jgi:hypothetical protein